MTLRPLCFLLAVLAVPGCAIGPDYQRPQIAEPQAFRQADGWKPAAPGSATFAGSWWRLYGDATLDSLVARLDSDNQSLASAEAKYRQARAVVRGARAGLQPTLDGKGGVSRAGQGGAAVSKSYEASLGVSWELDLWGKLRRQLESDRASMRASAAELAGVHLSLRSELVQNYLQLRIIDEQRRLFDATVQAYQRSLRLTENQYQAGIVPKSDVTQAMTQLKSTQAQAIDLEHQRAQLEHAIAVLIGVPPADFQLAEADGVPELPEIPLALPSTLLERRPDIAAAEQRVMAANASIGVAQAAYYPDLTLSASGGYRGSSLNDLISVPNRFWSIGPAFAMTLFDGGLIASRVEQAEASYDQTVAEYRQSVLDGFREVEDYLVQLQVFERESRVQREALEAARESLRLVENQYKAGAIDYNSVITVQTSALSNERSLLNLHGNRLTASVQLIAALGGGWEDRQAPD